MKKILSVLLVLVLAISSTFAGITLSGNASSELGYDISENRIGFTNSTKLKATVDAFTSEKKNEGDIYAGIKGTLDLTVYESDKAGSTIFEIDAKDTKINEAYIAGNNWKLSILSAEGIPTFAKGWEVDPDDEDNVLKFGEEYQDAVTGVTVTVYDWQVGAGFDVDFDEGGAKKVSGSLKTPEFAIIDGLTLQAGAGLTKNTEASVDTGFGLSAKYDGFGISTSASADFLVGVPTNEGEEATFDTAVAVSFSYAPVALDVFYSTNAKLPVAEKTYTIEETKESITYYASATDVYKDRFLNFPGSTGYTPSTLGSKNVEDYLSLKLVADLNSYNIPVVVTFAGLDLINTQYMDFEVKGTVIDALEITGFGGYHVEPEIWHFGGKVAYTFENVGKLSASTTLGGFVESEDTLAKMSVVLENTTLIPGATLKAGYETGFLSLSADSEYNDWGKIYASAKIEF